MDKLDDQLLQVKDNVRAKRKLEAMLQQALHAVQGDETMCDIYRKQVQKEKADVKKLEGLTLTALLSTVFGTKDEQLKREQQEYAEATLKLEQSELSLKAAKEQLHGLRQQLTSFANADAEYRRLIEEKEKLLSVSGNAGLNELLEITEQLADLTADRKELLEAIQAGQTAVSSLRDVNAELSSAAGWGTWDLLGGNLISTIAKHSKIDEAKRKGQYAQLQLERFQEELADAGVRLNVALEINGFSKFADFFFDGLIADWIVQSKIQNASTVCSSTITSVQLAVHQCERRLKEINQTIEGVNNTRLEFIEKC